MHGLSHRSKTRTAPKTLAFWTAVLLPIPVFFQISEGEINLATPSPSTSLPPVPISILLLIPILFYLCRRLNLLRRLARHNSGIRSLSVIFCLLVALSLLASAQAIENTLLILQWAVPIIWAFYGALLALFYHRDAENFALGLVLGIAAAAIYLCLGVTSDLGHFLAHGRIDPIDPPISGMYQLGNYTPAGLVTAGLLMLALKPGLQGPINISANVAGVAALLMSLLFLGSRETLLSIAILLLALLFHRTRGRRRPVVLLATVMLGFGLAYGAYVASDGTSYEIGSFARTIKTLRGEDASAGPDASRIEAYIGGRAKFARVRGLDKIVSEVGLSGSLINFTNPYGELGRSFGRQSTHNIYLELLLNFGVIGIGIISVLWFLWIPAGLRALRAVPQERSLSPFSLGMSVLLTLGLSGNLRLSIAQPYSGFLFYVTLGMLFISLMQLSSRNRLPRRPKTTLGAKGNADP